MLRAGGRPSLAAVEAELERVRYRRRFYSTLRSTILGLVVAAAAAVLAATLWMPVLQIYGTSMYPTLADGDVVLSTRTGTFRTGEVVAFYYNNKILVKRVIGVPGDWVDIEEDGTVRVNGASLEEPYVSEKALGDCNIQLPYQVPENHIFVMGDHRSVSVDSRNRSIGCVSEESVVGRIVFRAWPLGNAGPVA